MATEHTSPDDVKITTVGQLKATPGTIFVWVAWQGEEGDYVEVSRNKFLTAIGADVAYHRGGTHHHTHIRAVKRSSDGCIYVN